MTSRRHVLFVAFAAVGCATPSTLAPAGRSDSVSDGSRDSSTFHPASGALFVGCGYLVVDNHGSTHFTVLVSGKDVAQARKGESVFLVDGVLFETTATTAGEIGAPEARGLRLLRSYMIWESDWAKRGRYWDA